MDSDKNPPLLWNLVWLIIYGITLWLFTFLVTGDRIKLVRIISYFQPVFLFFLLPAFLIAVIGKKKLLATALCLLTLALGLRYIPLFLPRYEKNILPVTAQFSIMSFSVKGWIEEVQPIADIIKKQQADLTLVQGIPQPAVLVEKLQGIFPNTKVHSLYKGKFLAISRYPIRSLPFAGGAQKLTVALPSDTVTVWNVHLYKDPYNYNGQVKQVQSLIDDIQKTEGRKIAAGDFNFTESSVNYQDISKYLSNAHQQAGWGFGFTYPTPSRKLGYLMPLLRIDHIFYGASFYAVQADRLSEYGGSDHFPVVAVFSLR